MSISHTVQALEDYKTRLDRKVGSKWHRPRSSKEGDPRGGAGAKVPEGQCNHRAAADTAHYPTSSGSEICIIFVKEANLFA